MRRLRLVGAAILALGLGVLAILFSPVSRAQSDLAVGAEAAGIATDVVEGTVSRTVSVMIDGRPHSVSEVVVTATTKGTAGGTILVEVPGGEAPNGLVAAHATQPMLEAGVEVQLALVPGLAGEASTMLDGVAGTDATDVYSIVGGLQGVGWLSGNALSQLGSITSQGSGDFKYYTEPAAHPGPKKWPSFGPAPQYRVNTANSTVDSTQTRNAVNGGINIWEADPGSNINFTYAGSTTATGATADFNNVISWVSTPSPADSWIAQATFYFINSAPADIVGFDIEFNRDFNYAVNPNGVAGKHDIQTVSLHEFGHVLGLQHVFAFEEVMFPSVSTGSVRRIPGVGDIQGIRGLYGAGNQTCGGQPVTVDLAIGQVPTQGDDVIVGTARGEQIDALGGDDLVCAKGGDDTVNGGPGNDTIWGMSGNDELNGQIGDDSVFGATGSDTVIGGVGNDLLKGGPQNDTMFGGDGVDIIIGEDGDDTIFGQDGNDRLFGQAGNDMVDGGANNDVVAGGFGDDVLKGGSHNDEMFGGDGNDMLFGAAGDDLMSGGNGDDELDGEGNDDVLAGDDGADILRGGLGADDLRGGPKDDQMFGGDGNDLLRAAFGNDELHGNAGDDVMYGQDGNDDLFGGLGNDQLIAGNGNDTCDGGAGTDAVASCESKTGIP